MRNPMRLCLFLVALVAASPVAAQAGEGSMRYHLDLSVLEFASVSVEDTDASVLSVGVLPSSTGGVGPLASAFAPSHVGFGIGYGVTGDLIVGGRVVLGMTKIDFDGGGDESVTQLRLDPYVEYLFGHDGPAPFIGGALRLHYADAENVTARSFGLALIGGLHYFLSGGASIDITGLLGFDTGSIDFDGGPGDDNEVDTSAIFLGVLLGVSAWD